MLSRTPRLIYPWSWGCDFLSVDDIIGPYDLQPADLYRLLPALYRIKDSERGYSLKALLDIISDQANIVFRDIGGLWDSLFIETCQAWTIPYIADLVGNNPLHEVAARNRADVAKTIYYRRRKGTLAMLEELARDVTGWDAHAVPFFELLGWNQNLNHQRYSMSPNPGGKYPNSVGRVGTVNLRDEDALDQLGGPFDGISHSIDVRPVSRNEGWYNIRNIGFFLWRLKNFSIYGVNPRQSPGHQYGYSFSPLGNPAPLFNYPKEGATKGEVDVPGPIRSLSFRRNPQNYYGTDRSLSISIGGLSIPAAAVTGQDLSAWDRPSPTVEEVRGRLSGEIPSFSLTSNAPEVDITIDVDGPFTLKLSPKPSSLAEAQEALQSAIRGAYTSIDFTNARVVLVNNRLLVLSGAGVVQVSFAPSPTDTKTIADLALDAKSQRVAGIFSGDLSIFPELTSISPEMDVTIGSGGSHLARLSRAPVSLEDAPSLLEEAIRKANGTPEFAHVQVFAVGSRLLVLSGDPDEKISFSWSHNDETTFSELSLRNKIVAIDPLLGRFTFSAGEEPKSDSLSVYYNYGFSADIGGGSYERRDTLADLKDALEINIYQSLPSGADSPSVVTSLHEALNLASSENSDVVITINDSATYEETDLSIDLKDGKEMVIQAANLVRPNIRLSGDLLVKGQPGAALTLNGLLIEGAVHLDMLVEKATILHSTLVPGRYLDENGRLLEPDSPSLYTDDNNLFLSLEIDHSITGLIHISEVAASLTIRDSIVEKGKARNLPALISGILNPFPTLSSNLPSLNISIGCEGPYKITFSAKPLNLEEARTILEEAIKSVSLSPAFTRAQVMSVGGRIVLLSGTADDISASASNDAVTIQELKLDVASSRTAIAFISGQLSIPLTVSSPNPSVNLSIGKEGSHEINLVSRPILPVDAQFHLQSGLQAESSPAFSNSLVGILDERLVILPGLPGVTASFGPSQSDPSTVKELSLLDDKPSIAWNDGGFLPGPPTILERTTVFGSVFVKELSLASDAIFAERAVVERRQAGCVRFSYVPPESQTGRRYRCQPDMALAQLIGPGLTQEEKELVAERMKPSFTSVHYGNPAYTQLSLRCAEEIKTGSDDGSEMGAFGSLQQPQREANLRLRLDEYLPFGLDYGFIYVT